jgi:glutamyl-tRNA reductase
MERLHQFLSQHGQVELAHLAPQLYSLEEPESVQHLFSVASGLDSMVFGEGEILHQVKHAYEWATQDGAVGTLFHGLFQRALNTAKVVRTQTAIGRGATSIGTVAVELAEKIFGRLNGAVVVLLGAGKIGERTLKQLTARGVREIRIMNRAFDRAVELASTYQATPCALDQLASQLREADIVITSTSAPDVLLPHEMVAVAMRARHQRPLCLVDLGVPRNIDPLVGGLDNVYLFNIDDLQGVASAAHEARRQALSSCQRIIDEKVERFVIWRQRELASAS